jgi:hypothetical protein
MKSTDSLLSLLKEMSNLKTNETMKNLKTITAQKLIDVYGVDRTGIVFTMEGKMKITAFDSELRLVLADWPSKKITHRVLFVGTQN